MTSSKNETGDFLVAGVRYRLRKHPNAIEREYLLSEVSFWNEAHNRARVQGPVALTLVEAGPVGQSFAAGFTALAEVYDGEYWTTVPDDLPIGELWGVAQAIIRLIGWQMDTDKGGLS